MIHACAATWRIGASLSLIDVGAGELAVRSSAGARSVDAGFGTVALPDRPPHFHAFPATIDRMPSRIVRPEPGECFIRVRTIEIDGFVGPFGAPQPVDVPDGDLSRWLLMLPLFGLRAL